MNLSQALYKAARTSRDVHALTTKRVANRVQNKIIGRTIVSKLWRR